MWSVFLELIMKFTNNSYIRLSYDAIALHHHHYHHHHHHHHKYKKLTPLQIHSYQWLISIRYEATESSVNLRELEASTLLTFPTSKRLRWTRSIQNTKGQRSTCEVNLLIVSRLTHIVEDRWHEFNFLDTKRNFDNTKEN